MFLRVFLLLASVTAIHAHGLAREPQHHAVLIGVSRYPALPTAFQLQGPPNDVELLRAIFAKKGWFPPDCGNIRCLSETRGVVDAKLLPTRANILSEFERLVNVVGEEDQVIIFMAGHGAQQPQGAGAAHVEQDGLDQIFLPSDAGVWLASEKGGSIPNAISDDEIGMWTGRLRAKGARLWLIFDCCHSGDISRGARSGTRFVPSTEEGLRIPVAALKHIEDPQNAGVSAIRGAFDEGDQEGMAILYACERNEKAVESNFSSDAGGNVHGLLTYSLTSALTKSEGKINYRELGKRVHEEYMRLGYLTAPTPLIEGGDVTRSVLGDEDITRSTTTIRKDVATSKLSIDWGSLDGLTTNSILAVCSNVGESSTNTSHSRSGFVRVIDVRLDSSFVTPCAYGELPSGVEKDLIGRRCELERYDLGDLRIAIYLSHTDFDGNQIPKGVVQLLQKLLAEIAITEPSFVRQVNTRESSDWSIHWHQDNVYLQPTRSFAIAALSGNQEKKQRSPGMRVFSANDTTAECQSLRDDWHAALVRAARTSNLFRIISALSARPNGISSTAVVPEFTFNRFVTEAGRREALDDSPKRMRVNDVLEIIASNKGAVPFDLTLLYVDSRHGISALFPANAGINNRFHPGDSRNLPKVLIDGETTGREFLIAVCAHCEMAQPTSFVGLAEPSITRFRSGMQHNFEFRELLERGLYGAGKTRAVSRDDGADFKILTFPFDVLEGT